MSFNESNTVEQMILDALSADTTGQPFELKDTPGWGASLGGELRPAKWEYAPAADVPRQASDVMVEPWLRLALIRLNPEIANQPDRADEVIYALRAILLTVQADGLVRANENFMDWLRGEKTMPFGPNGELLDESQESTVYTARAREYMRENAGRLVAVVIPARVGRMWGILEPLEQVRIEIAEGRPAFSSWLGFWQYVVLAPLALAGIVIQWRRREPVLVIALWALLATITAATAFGGIRYRSGAEVAIVVFAAITLDALLRRRAMDRSSETSAGTDHDSSGGVVGDPTVQFPGN